MSTSAALVAAAVASKNAANRIIGAAPNPDAEKEKNAAKASYPRIFNKIVLTLENSLLPEEKLAKTPSFIDGLDPETEKDLRILGCEQIQTAGILLKLPQVAMATGQVLFQRFFYAKSFVRHNMETVAMSCIYLASKIEEEPRRVRDVMNVFHHIKQVRAQRDITPMIVDQNYTNLKTQVIKAERRVLKELGFCVHVKHPHKIIVMYLQVLKYERHEKLMQMSWNFMNDSLRTDVFMRYSPETIACACIYLSARKLGICLPRQPAWFSLFSVNEDDIIDICYRIMELYIRPKANFEKLEAAVEELRQRYVESRTKSKEPHASPAVTTVDRNDGSHNAWGGFIQRAVPLPLPPKDDRSESNHSRSKSKSRSRSPASRSRSRSHSRSRSRSRSPTSHSRSRSRSRTRSRSDREKMRRSKSKKKVKSRQYSRSPSPSPRHHKRKSSRDRDRSNYYSSSNKESSSSVVDKYSSKYDKYEKFEKYDKYEKYEKYDTYRSADKYADKYRSGGKHHHHQSRGYSHRGNHSTMSHQKHRSRDRKR